MNFLATPFGATVAVAVVLATALVASMRRRVNHEILPLSVSQELKGLAILLVVFGHVGYFLIPDHRFLFPLSAASGVGVDLFLFLSGYGLTAASFARSITFRRFYKERFLRIYIPLWITLLIFFILDLVVLHKTYGLSYILSSVVGFFPSANLWSDINSPLWYFTLIVGYYVLFPLVYSKRYPWFAALSLLLAGYAVTNLDTPLLNGVHQLYHLHIMAFPLGIIAAWIVSCLPGQIAFFRNRWDGVLRRLLLIALAFIACYLVYYSGVGKGILVEQLISLLAVLAIVGVFLLKRFSVGLLFLFGVYSYKIYLLHWPILARYDLLYAYLPAWAATVLYLVMFLVLGYVVKWFSTRARGLILKVL